MLKIKNLTLKNFLSIGNVTQSINFSDADLYLIIGENLDLGGNDNRNGVGKAQPLYCKIKTPTGWTTMGEISVGDVVSTPDGGVANVLGTFPQGKKPIYRVHFKDGRYTDACGEHLWETYSHSFRKKGENKTRILSTEQIQKHLEKARSHKNPSSGYIYAPLIVNGNENIPNLPIDPYLLGCLLGDGSLGKSGISFTTKDTEITKILSSKLPENIVMEKDSYNQYGYSFKCIIREKQRSLMTALKDLNLHGCLSDTKFIPDEYKGMSRQQIEELIAGLVDTDGHVTKTGAISISTSSERLAKDIQYLVWSIGGIARISSRIPSYTHKGIKRKGKSNYNVSIRYRNPNALSRLSRKKNLLPTNEEYQYKNLKNHITKVEYIGTEEAKCILIDHPKHLYVTDNFIVTHNTSIINGLSYALFGKPLVNIKLENLINKTNGKQMMATIEFEKNGNTYRIERGRKPVKLNFFVNDQELEVKESDETQGENRLTQKEIERVLGLSHVMFKNIIALNTFTEPFLSMKVADQREIIEQLLGITQLSQKADILKEELKLTRDGIREQEITINATKEANKRIEINIADQQRKSDIWDKSHEKTIVDTKEKIAELLQLDIDEEIERHQIIKENAEARSLLESITKDRDSLVREESRLLKAISDNEKTISTLKNKVCHTCGHDLDDEIHQDLYEKHIKALEDLRESLEECEEAIKLLNCDIKDIEINEDPVTFYESLGEAYNHKSKIESLEQQHQKELVATNPYIDNIENLKRTGLQEINYNKINELENLRGHQEFLLKLLTSKDSFIRKKIINQNLAYLNRRLESYLDKMGLPHRVSFQPDLSVEIQEHGRDLDFDNLSRGERTRLILSLSWAFRDVYESLNDKINLLFIDELIDNGLDVNGAEAALGVLKKMSRDNHRCIHLITHKDELMGRVDNVLKVVKEGGFTTFDLSGDM